MFLGRLLVALKRAGFILDVQSDVTLTHACNRFFHSSTALSMILCDMLLHVQLGTPFKSLVSHHFHRSYLKANKVSRNVKGQGK